ncbi:hypothetical protein DIPPA_15817 [Diplonema papillatum]|nr:hypothetical protein DIPPA_15817 [Diplonema papillatum]
MASSVRSRTPHACASPAAGCEAHCTARHPRSGSCAVGHNCPRGGRGAFPLAGPDFSEWNASKNSPSGTAIPSILDPPLNQDSPPRRQRRLTT